MIFKKWRPDIKGIHIVQHFPINDRTSVSKQITEIINKLENPIASLITFRNRPGTKYSHIVKRTERQNYSKEMAIKNVLTKYPMTEMIVMEGGENIVLYSSRPFKGNNNVV